MIKFIQKNMNKKGFTLVELIIVIAVMAILAAIVIPRMSGITTSFKEKADERMCENYAREIEVLIQLGEHSVTASSSGEVDDVLTTETPPTPESNEDGKFYYWTTGTHVTVFVDDEDGTTMTVTPTTELFDGDGTDDHDQPHIYKTHGGIID